MRGPYADFGTHARGKDAVATVVVDKLRRRMRQNGYRAHLTLQVDQDRAKPCGIPWLMGSSWHMML